MSDLLSARLRALMMQGEIAMLVRVTQTKGSTPRGTDAAMLVTDTQSFGTIGGGQLEFHAIDVARDLMAAGKLAHRLSIPLGAHLGQCCGGHVTLDFCAGTAAIADKLARDEVRCAEAFPPVLILGAGHTGRALAQALAPLPFAATLVDDRSETLVRLPQNIATLWLDDPARAIGAAPSGAAFVILTHSHALDYRLAQAALKRRNARYVGMIGSATKRARFERWFVASGGERGDLARLVCPIGGKAARDKRPEVIAALTAAELLVRCPADAAAQIAARETVPA
jgi:xanthine dehydrogenase accessory factor